ncbi:hypothetical protein OTU49_009972 [Cherax quadricarinatus]|uniref:Methyl-accepting transducer domain-containing protein n=1 Tax=Cherax quadricarinatus TaxID=27406 RepID=A0AAW0W913_CHEQU
MDENCQPDMNSESPQGQQNTSVKEQSLYTTPVSSHRSPFKDIANNPLEVRTVKADKTRKIMSRYDVGRELDEDEKWRDRTEVITRIDHDAYQMFAKEVINEVVNEVEKESVMAKFLASKPPHRSVAKFREAAMASLGDSESEYESAEELEEIDMPSAPKILSPVLPVANSTLLNVASSANSTPNRSDAVFENSFINSFEKMKIVEIDEPVEKFHDASDSLDDMSPSSNNVPEDKTRETELFDQFVTSFENNMKVLSDKQDNHIAQDEKNEQIRSTSPQEDIAAISHISPENELQSSDETVNAAVSLDKAFGGQSLKVVHETTPEVKLTIPQIMVTSSDVQEVVPEVKDVPVGMEATPEVKKDVPIVMEATPEVKKDVPVVMEATPEVKKDVAVVMEEAAPEVKKLVPLVMEATPEVKKDVAVVMEATPEVKKDIPVVKEATPEVKKDVQTAVGAVSEINVQVVTKTIPPGVTSVPAGKVAVPGGKTALPAKKATVPAGKTAAPAKNAAVPVGKASVPAGKASVPTGKAAVPAGKAIIPTRKTVNPVGKTVISVKKAVNPAGKAVIPVRKAVNSVGKAVIPAKKVSFPGGRVPGPTGKAPATAGKLAVATGRAAIPVPKKAVPERATISSVNEVVSEVSEPISAGSEVVSESAESISIVEAVSQAEEPISVVGKAVSQAEEPISAGINTVSQAEEPISVNNAVSQAEEPISAVNDAASQAEEPISAVNDAVLQAEEPISTGVSAVSQAEEPISTGVIAVSQAEEPISAGVSAVSQAEEPISAVNDAVSQAEEPISVVNNAVSQVEEPISAINNAVSQAEEPISVVNNAVSQAEEPISAVNDAVSQAEEPISVVNNAVSQVEEPILAVNDAVSQAEEPISAVDNAVSQAEEPISVVNDAVSQAEEPISAVNDAVSQAEEPVSAVNDAVSQAEEPVSAVNDAVSQAEEPVSAVNDAVSQAEEPVSAVNDAVSQAEEPVSAVNDAVSQAEEPVSAANDAVSQAEEPVSAANDAVSQAEEPVSAANDAVSQAEEPVSAANDAVSQAEEPVSTVNEAVSQAEPISSVVKGVSWVAETISVDTEAVPEAEVIPTVVETILTVDALPRVKDDNLKALLGEASQEKNDQCVMLENMETFSSLSGKENQEELVGQAFTQKVCGVDFLDKFDSNDFSPFETKALIANSPERVGIALIQSEANEEPYSAKSTTDKMGEEGEIGRECIYSQKLNISTNMECLAVSPKNNKDNAQLPTVVSNTQITEKEKSERSLDNKGATVQEILCQNSVTEDMPEEIKSAILERVFEKPLETSGLPKSNMSSLMLEESNFDHVTSATVSHLASAMNKTMVISDEMPCKELEMADVPENTKTLPLEAAEEPLEKNFPQKGYQLDFLDKLDDPNFNPFATKTTVANSPCKKVQPDATLQEIQQDEVKVQSIFVKEASSLGLLKDSLVKPIEEESSWQESHNFDSSRKLEDSDSDPFKYKPCTNSPNKNEAGYEADTHTQSDKAALLENEKNNGASLEKTLTENLNAIVVEMSAPKTNSAVSKIETSLPLEQIENSCKNEDSVLKECAVEFLDKFDDPNFNPFATKAAVQNSPIRNSNSFNAQNIIEDETKRKKPVSEIMPVKSLEEVEKIIGGEAVPLVSQENKTMDCFQKTDNQGFIPSATESVRSNPSMKAFSSLIDAAIHSETLAKSEKGEIVISGNAAFYHGQGKAQASTEEVNQHVFSPLPKGQAKKKENADSVFDFEEFTSAAEFFNNPEDFDELSAHGTDGDKLNLVRNSLYVKFDPLVSGRQSLAPYLAQHLKESNALDPRRCSGLISFSPSPTKRQREAEPAGTPVKALTSSVSDDTVFDATSLENTTFAESGNTTVVVSSQTLNNTTMITNITDPSETSLQLSVIHAEKMITERAMKEKLKNMELIMQDSMLRKSREFEEIQKRLKRQLTEQGIAMTSMEEENATLKSSIKQMQGVMAKILQHEASKEKEHKTQMLLLENQYEVKLTALRKECEQYQDELKKSEVPFFDLVKRFERLREVTAVLHKNEEALKSEVESLKAKMAQKEESFQSVVKTLEEAYGKAQEEYSAMKQNYERELKKASVMLKKAEVKILTLTETVEKTSVENQRLKDLIEDITKNIGGS